MDIDYKKQAVEAFNTIRTNISFLGVDSQIRKIMVTSSIKSEGKSTVSTNIANSYAFSKKRVLLIDCDMRNPTVHRVLELANRKGLSELIMAAKENVDPDDYILKYNQYMDVLTAGHRPPNPTELLSSKRMSTLVDRFAAQYDYIILDTPPVLIVPDAIALHPYVDGILLVVRHGYTTKEVLEDARKAFEVAGSKPSACVLNAIPDMQKRYSYYGYYEYTDTRSKKQKKNRKVKNAPYLSDQKQSAPAEAPSQDTVPQKQPAQKQESSDLSNLKAREKNKYNNRTRRKLH